MNPPQVYTCSPSRTPLPPPSLYHPSGSSQCTSPKQPVSCIELGLLTAGLSRKSPSIYFKWSWENRRGSSQALWWPQSPPGSRKTPFLASSQPMESHRLCVYYSPPLPLPPRLPSHARHQKRDLFPLTTMAQTPSCNCRGARNSCLPCQVLLAGLRIKCTWDRLTRDNQTKFQ